MIISPSFRITIVTIIMVIANILIVKLFDNSCIYEYKFTMIIEKDDVLAEIAKFLSLEKDKKNLTLEDISAKTWKSKVTASKILRWEYKVTIDTVREFAKVGLGIPPSTFDAKVQEITRKLVGVGESDSDPYSLLAKDGVKPEDIEKVKDFVQFIKSKY